MSKNLKKKINLGCGFDHREDYLNVDLNDFHKPDLIADVTDLYMLPENYFEEILAYDILEHIERTKTIKTLVEWNRILKIEGLLKIQVPSLIDLVDLLKKNQQDISMSQELIRACFGTQNYTGDFHYTSFTKQLITYQLSESGFELLTCKLRDDWLLELIAKKLNHVESINHAISKDKYKEKINDLYLRILKREADQGGLNYYTQQLIESDITIETVENILKSSQEYKEKFK